MTEIFKNIQWGDTVVLIFFSFGIVISIMTLFVGLMFFFKSLFRLKNKGQEIKNKVRRTRKKEGRTTVSINNTKINSTDTSDTHAVAIATAIYLYCNDFHDIESGIITIRHQRSRWR
jgi:hypothetical protein